MEDLATKIGSNLKKYRKLRGLTQQDIADLSGVSRKVVGELEKGKKSLSFETVLKIIAVTDLRLILNGEVET